MPDIAPIIFGLLLLFPSDSPVTHFSHLVNSHMKTGAKIRAGVDTVVNKVNSATRKIKEKLHKKQGEKSQNGLSEQRDNSETVETVDGHV